MRGLLELLKISAVTAVLLVLIGAGLVSVLAPHLGDALESACVKGRLSDAQAEAVNRATWERSPGYCDGDRYQDKSGQDREGQSHCQAERHDRVLAAHCATFFKVATHGD